MKLVVTGATGTVGAEVIRLALRNPAVTSVIALARKPVALPPNMAGDANATSKLHSVVLKDDDSDGDGWTKLYPASVQEQLKGADGCIWTLAVTPLKSKGRDFSEVSKICYDYTINGIEQLTAVANKPFRFVYTSGMLIDRNTTELEGPMAEYGLMRGRVERDIVDFGSKHKPNVQVTVTRPAFIDTPSHIHVPSERTQNFIDRHGYLPKIHVSELAAVMIDQCLNGITKDPITNAECVEMGKKLLKPEDYAV